MPTSPEPASVSPPPAPSGRRTFHRVASRTTDLLILTALSVGLILTVARFLHWIRPDEPPLADAAPSQESPAREADLTVSGWRVRHREQSPGGAPTDEARLARLRELARAGRQVSLPLAPDPVETGFREAGLRWDRREQVAGLEIRDTGGIPGTGALVLPDPRDPAGERILAWLAELPLPGGGTRTIETIRADLAAAMMPTEDSPEPESVR